MLCIYTIGSSTLEFVYAIKPTHPAKNYHDESSTRDVSSTLLKPRNVDAGNVCVSKQSQWYAKNNMIGLTILPLLYV